MSTADKALFSKAGSRAAIHLLRKIGLDVTTDNLDLVACIVLGHAHAIALMGGVVLWPDDIFTVEDLGGMPKNILGWLLRDRCTLRIHSEGTGSPTRTILLKVGDSVVVRKGVYPRDAKEVLESMRGEIENTALVACS